jgi:PKD repeat protein
LSATVQSGTNVSYTWDFGDGETGSGQIVTHTYPHAGIFTASVTATNPVSSLSTTTQVDITSPVKRIFLPMAVRSG